VIFLFGQWSTSKKIVPAKCQQFSLRLSFTIWFSTCFSLPVPVGTITFQRNDSRILYIFMNLFNIRPTIRFSFFSNIFRRWRLKIKRTSIINRPIVVCSHRQRIWFKSSSYWELIFIILTFIVVTRHTLQCNYLLKRFKKCIQNN